jgi:allophanate hydrolase
MTVPDPAFPDPAFPDPGFPESLPDLSTGARRAGYRDGALDPLSVASLVHARARQSFDENIWITLRDLADLRAAAEKIMARWPDPRARPPLFGIPVAVKDNIDVTGLPTTAACPDFTYVPATSATLVSLLTEAGALIVGKTNLDQFATGLTGTRSPYGICRSPFSPAHIAGGSSSGSALAVARGLVSVAIGTDTAGSGRVPAAFTGTIGLKPSRGLVSGLGMVPACRSLDCPSVFATSVADAEATLRVMAGYDPADPWSREFPGTGSGLGAGVGAGVGAANGPRVLRVGVCDDDALGWVTDEEIVAAYRLSASRLSSEGMKIVPVDVSPLLEAGELLYGGPFVAERLTFLEDLLQSSPRSFYRDTRQVLLKARDLSAADAFRGIHRLAELRCAARRLWQDVDAVLLPTVPFIPTVDQAVADSNAVTSALGRYTTFTNLMDLAAMAVPAGFRQDGLPVGVSLHAPAGGDELLAGLAAALTTETSR